MKSNTIIVIFLSIIVTLIAYNLYKNDNDNSNNKYYEHFGSLDKMKKKK